MSKARLYSSMLLVFAVTACGGDDSGVSLAGAAPFVVIPNSSTAATPTPAPAPAPAPAPQPSSLLPFIDNSKIPAAEVGFASVRIKPEPNYLPIPSTDGTASFRITCTFSHMNYDDPIVFPGKQGATHLHTFFGNTAVNYASTQQSIESTGNSTCTGGTANRTGYWVPAIIDTKDGTPIKPDKIMVYYKTSYIEGDNVKPFPAGLRMVAGDMKASGPQEHIYWECRKGGESGTRSSTIPTNCPVGYIVEANIDFPFCWDGVNLDSPDHKSHMSQWTQLQSPPWTRMCPASHPVELPVISEKVQYVVTEAGSTARWRLSSDNYDKTISGGYSLHADWFNGWDPKVQDTWFKNCLMANRDCHAFLLGDGTTLY